MSNQDSFVHLHVHSEYSLLDGATKLKALCKEAAAQGMPAVALTDHGVMFGAFEFYKAAQEVSKEQGVNLKPIIGVEAYMAPNGRFEKAGKNNAAHVTLLAMNPEGYRNLIKLVSIGYTEGYYYKPRIDMEVLAKHNAGIICLSGCLSGLVQEPLQHGDYDGAKAAAQAYKDIFGDRFYLELMRHDLDDQNKVEDGMLRLSRELGVKLVATNDSHYLHHHDHEFHEVFCCLQTGAKLSDEKRFRLPGDQFYVKSAKEMREKFADMPEVCDVTLEIAARIEDVQIDADQSFHIPTYPVPDGTATERRLGRKPTDVEYLRSLCEAGLKKRYGNERAGSDKALRERLDYELSIMEKMGFSSYFLIVWDFIKFARDNDIPVGPGRGSAVGSIVSYCLGITALDPLRFGLYFERFLNPDRISMPDIDTDFCIEGRERVIQYVTEKYGADRVAGIVTFGTMAARAAVRDAARVYDVPLPIVDRIAKLIPGGPKGLSVKEAREQISELQALERQDESIQRVLNMAQQIEGYVRNIGTHAAAVVISDAPLTEYIPLVTVEKNGSSEKSLNTQFEMGWVEKLGLLKMDFLGLRNLTVMRAAEKEIQRTVKADFVLATIPDDDKKTYAMLARGETTGVFQLESEGMRRMLVEMKPDRLEDIVAAVALYRPGPMELIPQYIGGKHGRITPQYLHPKLEPILADTHGIAIYQEQVMQIARDIAGYTMGQADELRKVMGKKIKEKVAEQRKKFVAGAEAQGVKSETAERIFDFVEPFAGYGFNKSHAVAYGWISYQTAYLKANYPVQYLAALMTSVGDKTDKLVEYIEEARQRGIEVLPPDVNVSNSGFTVADGAIRFGFGAIKGITPSSVESIIVEREANGSYTDLFDLVDRTRVHGAQKKTIETLAKVGALDSLPGNRSQKLAALDSAFERANLDVQDRAMGQMSFFGEIQQTMEAPTLPDLAEPSNMTLLNWEREGLGIYVSGHPVDNAKDLLEKRKALTISQAKTKEGRSILVGGMIGSVRRVMTKAGKMMLISSIEDRTGFIEVVVFPGQYETTNALFVEGSIVAIAGQVRSRERFNSNGDDENEAVEVNLIVNGIETIAPVGWEPLPKAG